MRSYPAGTALPAFPVRAAVLAIAATLAFASTRPAPALARATRLAPEPAATGATGPRVAPSFGSLPVSFEPNVGQAPLASISTCPEATHKGAPLWPGEFAASEEESLVGSCRIGVEVSQANHPNRIRRDFPPTHGIGVGSSARPDAIRNGLCARLSIVTTTS